MLLDRGSPDEASADFTSALALEPRNADALASRGVAHTWKGDAIVAKNLDTAAAIDPHNAAIYHGRA